jgi:glycosyltransferase involved in cell wall biosynthesis
MHILVIPSEHFVTERVPLGGIFQFEQAKALQRAGHKVGVIAVGFISPRYFRGGYPYQSKETVDGLAVIRDYKKIYLPHKVYPIWRIFGKYISLFKRNFQKYVEEYGAPDVVHAHNSFYAGVIADFVQREYGIPFVLTEHSSAFARGMVPSRANEALKGVFKRAASISCVSSPFKSELEQRFDVPVSVLHNLVDRLFFADDLDRPADEQFKFISIASLDSNKNLALALASFASELKGARASFTVVGDGPLRDELVAQCETLGISGQVRFLGRLSREGVRDEMMKANCLVLSSNYETFGVVLIEALACGLPLISTRCGGPDDIVNEGNGLLVDVGSQDQLASAMRFIMDNHDKYSGDELRRDALTRFGEAAFVRRVVSVYEQALGRY